MRHSMRESVKCQDPVFCTSQSYSSSGGCPWVAWSCTCIERPWSLRATDGFLHPTQGCLWDDKDKGAHGPGPPSCYHQRPSHWVSSQLRFASLCLGREGSMQLLEPRAAFPLSSPSKQGFPTCSPRAHKLITHILQSNE